MKKISLARQYQAMADIYLNLHECPGCGNLRNKGYFCAWIEEGCPGD
jgi:hypothetical protein